MQIAGRNIYDKLIIDAKAICEELVKCLKQKFAEEGFSRAVIGISGGVDSSVASALAVRALGKQNVLGVILPYRTTNPDSIKDAKVLIDMLGIPHEQIDISAIVDSYCDRYGVAESVRRGNVMARVRMIVLYDISAREKALVIGTSNRTELVVGYGTLHGDLACAVNPVGDLYKSQVWQIAEDLGIPEQIIKRTPTADLWQGQTDEGELGLKYEILDKLLYEMIDNGRSRDDLIKIGFDASVIDKISERIRRNEFKRKPPFIPKISRQ